MFLINIRLRKRVIKLFQKMVGHLSLFLTATKIKNCVHGLEFATQCYKTQELCDKAVHRCFLYLILFPIDKRPKKCVTVVSEDPFMIDIKLNESEINLLMIVWQH